ncbi:MAG: hypothetical protein SFZ03_06075, partial [Candidatus Melainabacteria bacterium]|nr:hypothetical protein [Candidatus Melainabacteria bacterium]
MQPLCRNFNSAYSTSLPATLSNTPASLPNVRFSQEQPAPKTPVPVEVKGFSQKTTNTLLVVFGS